MTPIEQQAMREGHIEAIRGALKIAVADGNASGLVKTWCVEALKHLEALAAFAKYVLEARPSAGEEGEQWIPVSTLPEEEIEQIVNTNRTRIDNDDYDSREEYEEACLIEQGRILGLREGLEIANEHFSKK